MEYNYRAVFGIKQRRILDENEYFSNWLGNAGLKEVSSTIERKINNYQKLILVANDSLLLCLSVFLCLLGHVRRGRNITLIRQVLLRSSVAALQLSCLIVTFQLFFGSFPNHRRSSSRGYKYRLGKLSLYLAQYPSLYTRNSTFNEKLDF